MKEPRVGRTRECHSTSPAQPRCCRANSSTAYRRTFASTNFGVSFSDELLNPELASELKYRVQIHRGTTQIERGGAERFC